MRWFNTWLQENSVGSHIFISDNLAFRLAMDQLLFSLFLWGKSIRIFRTQDWRLVLRNENGYQVKNV